MNKFKLTIAAIFISVFTVLTIQSCNKNDNSDKINVKNVKDNNNQTMVPSIGGGTDKNYCLGCGQNSNWQYVCNQPTGLCLVLQEDDPICYIVAMDEVIEEYSLGHELDFQLCYDIRDSFLMKSELGQMYHTYYYRLGQIALDNNMINLSTVGSYYLFYTQLTEALDVLFYGSSNEVPFDNNFKVAAMSFVNDYRALSLSQSDIDMLDKIENDLDTFTGMTKQNILSTLVITIN
jgi:hypothetical protein